MVFGVSVWKGNLYEHDKAGGTFFLSLRSSPTCLISLKFKEDLSLEHEGSESST